jgi:hypothetical protein
MRSKQIKMIGIEDREEFVLEAYYEESYIH